MVWVMHGKIFDKFDEFFIYKLIKKKDKGQDGEIRRIYDEGDQLKDWDSFFSMRYSMLPKKLINPKTAEKLLFIGKSVRVLLIKDKERGYIFDEEILGVIKEAAEFDFLNFQTVIEKIRVYIAERFLRLFMEKENIIDHLHTLRNYFLLGKGEFFRIFVDECEKIFSSEPTENAESDINNKIFQNSLIRLNWLDYSIVKEIRFTIQNNGFQYQDFNSLNGIDVVGRVEHYRELILRIQANNKGYSSGCIWKTLKQNIENGFDMKATIRFRRGINTQINIPSM